jgi:hypothetical protein
MALWVISPGAGRRAGMVANPVVLGRARLLSVIEQ